MTKRALVFGGGGARGAYEIGVWMAMDELNIHVDIVVGTSIGALNGAMYAQQDLQTALDIWNNMSHEAVIANGVNIDYDLDYLMSQRHQVEQFIKQFLQRKSVDITPLKQLIQRCLNEGRLRASPIHFGLCTLEVPKNLPHYLTTEDIPVGKMKDYLLASASCFPVFPLCQIDGRYFIDGGYYDNVPIQLAKRMGAEEYIVVDLKSRPKLDYKHRLYKNVTFISPFYPLGSFLNFDGELARKGIRLGYLDAMKRFHQYYGFAYTFEKQIDNSYMFSFLHVQEAMQKRFDSHPRFRSFFHRVRSSSVKNIIMMNEGIEDFALALRFCEIAGEVLGIDRYEIYDFHGFNQEVLRRYGEAQQRYLNIPTLWQEVRSVLRFIDPVMLMMFLVRQLEEVMTGVDSLDKYLYLMSLQGNEMHGAMYVYALQCKERNTEKNRVNFSKIR